MNDMHQTDSLRNENWAGVYAQTPDAVTLGVKLAFVRIRERERRRRRVLRIASAAACMAIVAGLCAASFSAKRGSQLPDQVLSPVSEARTLCAEDVVYAANDDPCFHVYENCPCISPNAVSLPLMTAQEFGKTLCESCGANVQITP